MAALLARASKDRGAVLEWSESDKLVLDEAAAAADRAQQLRRRFAEVLDASESDNRAVIVSAEVRLLDRLVIDSVLKLEAALIPQKTVSERHRRSANARWAVSS
jgi:hypothetical protein